MNMAAPPVKVSRIAPLPDCCQRELRHSSAGPMIIANGPRHSSSSLVASSPPRCITSPPSPDDSRADLTINTPWSTPPTSSSGGSIVKRSRSRHRSSADSTRPVVHQSAHVRTVSPVRTITTRTLIVPAGSGSPHHPSSSRSYSRYTSSARSERSTRSSRYYDAYSKGVDVVNDQQAGHDFPRPGRTKFPRKLVSREAVEDMKYPYTIEDGCVVILQALGRPEIETLVDLTEELRRRGEKKRDRKAVSFYEKTIVHQPPPVAPTPPASDIMSQSDHTEVASRAHTPAFAHNSSSNVLLVPAASSRHSRSRSRSSRYQSYTMRGALPSIGPPGSTISFEPLSPPGPSTPKPIAKKLELGAPETAVPAATTKKTPEEKIARIEHKAIKADKVACQKEYRALRTGCAKDEHNAWKARNKAEELVRKVEETERRERRRDEERTLRRNKERETRRLSVGRNRRGELVVIRG